MALLPHNVTPQPRWSYHLIPALSPPQCSYHLLPESHPCGPTTSSLHHVHLNCVYHHTHAKSPPQWLCHFLPILSPPRDQATSSLNHLHLNCICRLIPAQSPPQWHCHLISTSMLSATSFLYHLLLNNPAKSSLYYIHPGDPANSHLHQLHLNGVCHLISVPSLPQCNYLFISAPPPSQWCLLPHSCTISSSVDLPLHPYTTSFSMVSATSFLHHILFSGTTSSSLHHFLLNGVCHLIPAPYAPQWNCLFIPTPSPPPQNRADLCQSRQINGVDIVPCMMAACNINHRFVTRWQSVAFRQGHDAWDVMKGIAVCSSSGKLTGRPSYTSRCHLDIQGSHSVM